MQTIYQGLPERGAEGQFIGFDKDGNAYVIEWSPQAECWGGCGFDPKPGVRLGFCFFCRDTMADFIMSHARPANTLDAG